MRPKLKTMTDQISFLPLPFRTFAYSKYAILPTTYNKAHGWQTRTRAQTNSELICQRNGMHKSV